MKPIAALLALLALAVGAAPAAAEQRLAVESAPVHRRRLRRRDRVELLRRGDEDLRAAACCARGQSITPAVEPSGKPFDLDVGPGPDGAPLVVYARAGDLFQFDPATRPRAAARRGQHARASRAARASTAPRSPSCARRQPQARSSTCARTATRAASRARASRRRSASRARAERRAACSSSTAPTSSRPAARGRCSTASPAASCAGSSASAAAARTSASSSRPASFGHSIFFARTNDGSGQGNNLFRFDLRSRKLFSARGTSRAMSLTWRGDRFLMSRDTTAARAPDGDPLPADCELVLTDPHRVHARVAADQRRTRP